MGKPYSLYQRKHVVAAIEGEDIPQSGRQAVWSGDQHGHRLDAAGQGDRQC